VYAHAWTPGWDVEHGDDDDDDNEKDTTTDTK
jgi:hypothetical protein